MPRVAVLHSLAESDFEAQSWVNALKQGLVALGWNVLDLRVFDHRAQQGNCPTRQDALSPIASLCRQSRRSTARRFSPLTIKRRGGQPLLSAIRLARLRVLARSNWAKRKEMHGGTQACDQHGFSEIEDAVAR